MLVHTMEYYLVIKIKDILILMQRMKLESTMLRERLHAVSYLHRIHTSTDSMSVRGQLEPWKVGERGDY
jgi:hypothetical protein